MASDTSLVGSDSPYAGGREPEPPPPSDNTHESSAAAPLASAGAGLEGGTASVNEADSLFSLSDDELWDVDGDISLFEKGPVQGPPGGATEGTAGDGGEVHASIESASRPQEDGAAAVHHSAEAGAIVAGATEQPGDHEGRGPQGQPWLLLATGAVATILLIVGIVVVCAFIASSHDSQGPGAPDKARAGAKAGLEEGRQATKQQAENSPGPGVQATETSRPSAAAEVLALDPFLIPAHLSGEIVFLKVQLELVVQDAGTLRAMRRKETWVRDVIYRELKGIDIEPSAEGDFLQQFRRPIRERLNQELAPLQVVEVKIMGFLLK